MDAPDASENPSQPTAAELIAHKRDGGTWSAPQIEAVVRGLADGSWSDAQAGALAMAVFLRGAGVTETSQLTLAMRDSGSVLDTSSLDGPKVDKHSTGGVGDKVSLLLAPWVAACGLLVPMISGRGLGHTGGTLDKLEAIPGYRVDWTPEQLLQLVGGPAGYGIVAASADLAPADRRLYAVRDVTGTVASIPLIVSSILSKKLAAGLDALVLDVKVGRAAFLPERERGRELARALVATARAAGVRCSALLTDMDQPLGQTVGNALEVREVLDVLNGAEVDDLMGVTRALASEMLVVGGVAADDADALSQLDRAWASGKVHEHFALNVAAQGGPSDLLEAPDRLPTAPATRDVPAPRSGYVTDLDPMAVGRVALSLGAGRRRGGDAIDPRVGVVCRAKPVAGARARVEAGEPLATVHAASESAAAGASEALQAAWRIQDAPVDYRGPILERIDAAADV